MEKRWEWMEINGVETSEEVGFLTDNYTNFKWNYLQMNLKLMLVDSSQDFLLASSGARMVKSCNCKKLLSDDDEGDFATTENEWMKRIMKPPFIPNSLPPSSTLPLHGLRHDPLHDSFIRTG